MATHRPVARLLLAVSMLTAASASALDLGRFQEFLSSNRSRTPSVSAPAPARPPARPPVRLLSEDADAVFGGQTQVLTLEKRPHGVTPPPLSLPSDTRVPAALRPLLTDRKYPKQGSAVGGSTGGLLVPSPGVLEKDRALVSVHAMPFALYNINDNQIRDADYFDTSIKADFGAWPGFEIGIEKTYNNQDRFDLDLPLYVNAKYQVPGNITLGTSLCTDANTGYSSFWVAAGLPAVWAGVGVNFGCEDYHFYYRGYDKLRRAKYGGYNYDYNTAKGYADPVFFMVGGALPMNRYSDFVYDFNGDRFSLGMRFNYQRTVFFDAFFVSDGDYERLPGPISHRRYRNFVFGGGVAF